MISEAGLVDIWLFPFDTVDAGLRRRCLALLDIFELAQLDRFALERPRDQYLVSRALVRLVLSRYAECAPDALRFTRDEYGRPWLSAPDEALGLYFSLSHTEGLVALAVSSSRLMGLDVEDAHRTMDVTGIAQTYFELSEWATLSQLQGDAQRASFFDVWTCKEAYIKACGKGLQIPLDQFAVEVTHSSAKLTVLKDASHALNDWQFYRAQPTPRHKLAVAALSNPRVSLDCRMRWLSPLLQWP